MNPLIPVILLLCFASCINNNNAHNSRKNNSTIDTAAMDSALNAQYAGDTLLPPIEDTDTISVGKYLLYFERADSIVFPPYYDDEEIRDSIWRVIDNSHEAVNAVENYLKNKLSRIFTSDDSTLTIKLNNGKTLTFPKWDEEKMEGFCFDNYFNAIDYALLYVQYYEGRAYMLVNRKNGFKQYIFGLPYFSKDNQSFITLSTDLEAHYCFNGIEYYTMQADTFMKMFELPIDDWGPEKAKWLTGNSILLKKDFGDFDVDTSYSGTGYTIMTISHK